ncbi:MAG: TetR/AcrR family transcriptional regulator [Actinomycetes bacterium]
MRSGRGDETRARLLRAAQEVIAGQGWGGVTTRAVADTAGLNAGLVHYHFGSVDALRRQAVRGCLDELVTASLSRLRAVDESRSAGRGLGDVLATMQRREPQATVVLFEAFLASLRDPGLREELGAMLRASRVELAGWLGTRPGVRDPDALAGLVVAALDGAYLHRLVDPDVDPATLLDPLGRLLSERDYAAQVGR